MLFEAGFITCIISAMAIHPSIEELGMVELVVLEDEVHHGQGGPASPQCGAIEPSSLKTEPMSRQVMVTIGIDMVALVLTTALQLVVNKFLTIPMANYPSALTVHSVFWVSPYPTMLYDQSPSDNLGSETRLWCFLSLSLSVH